MTTDEPNLIVTNLGHLNLVVSRIRARVCVQAKVRTKGKDDDEETRRQKDMKEKKGRRLWGRKGTNR